MQIPPEIWHAPDLFYSKFRYKAKRIQDRTDSFCKKHAFHHTADYNHDSTHFIQVIGFLDDPPVFREIFRRRLMNIIFASAISPIPPICIRHRITAFPMGLHWTAITTVESPVTHTLVAAVKQHPGR